MSALTLACSVLALAAPALFAQQTTIVNVDNFRPNELYCKAFEVNTPMTIHIKATGGGIVNDEQLSGYAWIIPSGELDPIWVMDADNTEAFGRRDRLREYDSSLELEPGKYEVYFYAGASWNFDGFNINFDWDKLKQEIKALLDDKEITEAELKALERGFESGENTILGFRNNAEEIVKEYSLLITCETGAPRITTCDYSSRLSIAEVLRPGNDEYAEIGFSLAKPTEVEVQAIGEIVSWGDSYADYAWIIDADSRKRVWSMDNTRLEWAGGAEKNKMAKKLLQLPAGNYLLYYVTDDSHSFDEWNAAPPYNPEAYGVRVSVVNERDKAAVKPYQQNLSQKSLVSIVRVGDGAQETRAFRVNRDTQVRVYAIGEYSEGSGEFADYAWIEREGLEDPVWLMLEDNTEPAGGARKNRLADEVITLSQGDYILGYVSDDSHAYGDWNASAPYDQKNYGVTLFAVDQSAATAIAPIAETEIAAPRNVLAEIIRVGDDADESELFTLDQPTRVRIVALGEGQGNEMYDYGWIERVDDKEIVWEMTYRRSKPAGGADKNRIAESNLLLDKGRYRLRYVTDGSHAFGSWNADRPRSAQRWGISVYRAE